MKALSKVIEKASQDQKYAEEMARKYLKVGNGGEIRGEDKADVWRDLLTDFADSPEELARMVADSTSVTAARTWTTATTATFTCAFLGPAGPLTVTTITTVTTIATQEA